MSKQRTLDGLPPELVQALADGRAIDEELREIVKKREKLDEKELRLLEKKAGLKQRAERGNARPGKPGKAGMDKGDTLMSEKNDKSSEAGKQIPPVPIQLSLFYYDVSENYTNVINLYHEIPKYVCDAPRDSKHLDTIERTFKVKGSIYNIALHPARIKDAEGNTVEQYIGIREEVVEDAITKIAVDKKRLFVLQDTTRIRVSIREIDTELRRIGKTYSYQEIKDAILVLAGARMVIENDKGKAVWSTSTYPEIMLSTDAEDGQGFVQLHPLVCEGIKHGLYIQIDYTLAMGLPGRYSRRLYKLLATKFTWAGMACKPFDVHLKSFVDKHGFKVYARITDNAKMFRESLKVLQAKSIIMKWKETPKKKGRKTVDICYSIFPAPSFVRAMKRGQGIKNQIQTKLEADHKL